MKTKFQTPAPYCRSSLALCALLILSTVSPKLSTIFAQGTALTYQGRLDSGGNPATGLYDLTFAVYDSANGPNTLMAGPLTNPGTPVTNGLFTVLLDFGVGVFTGPNRWLEIGVRTNGGGLFATLTPRQPLLPVPYAVFAGSANAAGLAGTLPPGAIANGSISASQLASGAALSNLNASGQSVVPASGIILSATNDNAALQNAGYVKIGSVQSDDRWVHHSSGAAPAGRNGHSAIWTGTEMIIWGGDSFADGGRYNPITDTWTTLSTNNAPAGRSSHTALWTGTEMIIWGGLGSSGFLNDGGRYNPATDTWTALSTNNAPSIRSGYTAIWTGTEMVIWGGKGDSVYFIFNDGGRYNPVTDAWTAISTNNAPTGRASHTAVWTGARMIVWGGYNETFVTNIAGLPPNFITNIIASNFYLADGGRYDPFTDTWAPVDTVGIPDLRTTYTTVWTGTEMLVWGGHLVAGTFIGNNARYNPTTDSWVRISGINAPAGRDGHSAVWTGTEMFVWGGADQNGFLLDGGRYSPTSDSWRPLTMTGSPGPRSGHTAVWTGAEMLLWGGGNGSDDPNDTWSLTPGNPIYLYLKP
jgi:N-acetylneuraminic acid mutarotase